MAFAGDEQLIGAPLDAGAIARDWAKEGSKLDAASRRSVVALLIHQLGRPRGRVPAWTDGLFDLDVAVALSVDDGRALRRVLHEHVVANRPPAEAVRMQSGLGVLVDDLILAAARHSISALEEAALLDSLTGLRNRHGATLVFDSALAHGRRHNRPVAVAVADLVGLKRINDTQGHAAGDDALRRFAAAMSDNLRGGDAGFRFGGDEFVVIAPDTTEGELHHLFERLGNQTGTPAFSVGIAEAPLDGDDAATLLAVADERLYDGRRGTVSPPRRVLSGIEVGVVTLALATAGVIVAESVRSRAGIDVQGIALTAWHSALLGTAFLMAAMSWHAGPADVRGAVRRATGLAGIATLALLASLTPLVSVIDRRIVSETAAPGNDTTATNGPIELSAPQAPTVPAMPSTATAMPPTVASQSLPRGRDPSTETSGAGAGVGPRSDEAFATDASDRPTPTVTAPTTTTTIAPPPTTVPPTTTTTIAPPPTTVPPTTTSTVVETVDRGHRGERNRESPKPEKDPAKSRWT